MSRCDNLHIIDLAALNDAGRVGFHQFLNRFQRLALQFYQIVARPAAHTVLLCMFFHLFNFFV